MPIQLHWQWPNERAATEKIVVTILNIKDANRRLNSPSIDGYIPDPVVITAIATEVIESAKTFELVLPKVELNQIQINDQVILGLIDKNICIAITKLIKQ